MTWQPFTSTCIKTTHTVPASHPRNRGTVHYPDARLQLSVDEYTILGEKSDAATLVFTHGTSFNKNLWEPTIWRLLKALDCGASSGCVKRILAIDASNHGDSYVSNEKLLTQTSHWPDQSRDILQVLRYFRVEQPVIGIGHSFGGGIMAHAAILDPSAFLATVFIDPILFQMKEQTEMIANRALKRRDRWNSSQDVRSSFTTNKGFSDWHPEVLNLHIQHSTKDFQDGEKVARVLKTPKEQEAATYLAAPHPDLPNFLAESTQNHYFILGGKSIVVHPPDREWIKSTTQTPKHVVIMEAGHLIPMTHPEELALHIRNLLCGILPQQASTSHTPNPRSLL
ncbi:Alpha/beta hydrolase family-domain-containing protein [Leptodontidium sp. 2 PMI_412]|nr:Alpha/beta hydrolase family-domain-containing protein [Leptodontidium sp. 2 PMI_412]